MGNKITYTTDVAHCMGRDCPPRERCHRYWLHKNNKAKYSGMSFAPYIDEEYSYETEECEMFKPIEP